MAHRYSLFVDPTVLAAVFGAGGAVFGALLATLGSWLSNRVALRTARQQIEADAVQQEAARQEARAEWWRERRFAVHESFFTELLRTEEQVYTSCERWEQAIGGLRVTLLDYSIPETFRALRGARSQLTLMSIEAIELAADEVYASLRALYSYYGDANAAADMGAHGHFPLGRDVTGPMWQRTAEAKAAYLTLARRELGTAY